MKSALLAAASLLALSVQANATIVQSGTLPSGPYSSPVTTTFTPAVNFGLTSSVTNEYRSPFEGTSSPNAPYTSIQGDGSATFNLGGNVASFIWGSPDTYNSLKLFSGVGATGTLLEEITGSSIVPTNGTGFSYVTLSDFGTFGSLVFANTASPGTGNNAFEISTLSVSSVPLPASFPMFGGGLLALAAFGYLVRGKAQASTIG